MFASVPVKVIVELPFALPLGESQTLQAAEHERTVADGEGDLHLRGRGVRRAGDILIGDGDGVVVAFREDDRMVDVSALSAGNRNHGRIVDGIDLDRHGAGRALRTTRANMPQVVGRDSQGIGSGESDCWGIQQPFESGIDVSHRAVEDHRTRTGLRNAQTDGASQDQTAGIGRKRDLDEGVVLVDRDAIDEGRSIAAGIQSTEGDAMRSGGQRNGSRTIRLEIRGIGITGPIDHSVNLDENRIGTVAEISCRSLEADRVQTVFGDGEVLRNHAAVLDEGDLIASRRVGIAEIAAVRGDAAGAGEGPRHAENTVLVRHGSGSEIGRFEAVVANRNVGRRGIDVRIAYGNTVCRSPARRSKLDVRPPLAIQARCLPADYWPQAR